MDKLQAKIFQVFVDGVYAPFCLLTNLRDKRHNTAYKNNLYFWSIVIDAITVSFLVKLATLFDKDSDKKHISFYHPKMSERLNVYQKNRIKKIMFENSNVLTNLKKWRDRLLDHNDTRALPLDIFVNKFPIKYPEIAKLVTGSKEITEIIIHEDIDTSKIPDFVLDSLQKKVKKDYICTKNYDEEIKNDVHSIIERLL